MEQARDKAARRVERKEGRVAIDRASSADPDVEGIVPGPQALPYDMLEGDVTGDQLVKAAIGAEDEDTEEEAS